MANLVYDKTTTPPPKDSLKSFIFEYIRSKREYDDALRFNAIAKLLGAPDDALRKITEILGSPSKSDEGAEKAAHNLQAVAEKFFKAVKTRQGDGND